MKKISLLIILAMAVVVSSFAQGPAKKGKYTFLKGETSLQVSYSYDNMLVGKQIKEEEYTARKVKEGNEKEPGQGDKWLASWEDSRETRYQPKFETLINDQLEKSKITVSQDAENANYKLIVKTVYTEPGFNIGVMKKPASVNFEFVFIEIKTEKEVARYTLERVPGSQVMGYDYDVGSRIAESYAKGGKMLGAYIAKSIK